MSPEEDSYQDYEVKRLNYEEFDNLPSEESVRQRVIKTLKKGPVDIEALHQDFPSHQGNNHVLDKLIEEGIVESKICDSEQTVYFGLSKECRKRSL